MKPSMAIKVVIVSLAIIASLYSMVLFYLLYVSAMVGEVQNMFSTVLWLSLVLWCIVAVKKGSIKALFWAKILFGVHLFFSVFSILFPPPTASDAGHYVFMIGLLCAATISLIGLVVSFFTKERLKT